MLTYKVSKGKMQKILPKTTTFCMKLVKKVLLMFMEHIFGKLPPDFYVH
jgi:hypothetical protein